jgi:hypothetical protein
MAFGARSGGAFMSRHTGPPGYESNAAAMDKLIKFGGGIWTPSQMMALLYHAERSTAVGKDADQHSESQATEGIYSIQQLRWIRGPSGLSRSTWHRVNGELAQTEERPHGVLRKILRTDRFGGADSTEYCLDWLEIKSAIEHWEREGRNLPKGWWETWALSQIGRPPLSQIGRATEGLSEGLPLSTEGFPLSQIGRAKNSDETLSQIGRGGETLDQSTPETLSQIGRAKNSTDPLSQIGRDSQSIEELTDSGRTDYTDSGLFQVRPSESPNVREAAQISAAAIADAIEQATGERPRTAELINKILNVGKQFSLPEEAIIDWIHGKSYEVRARKKMLSPGLLGKAIGEDMPAWVIDKREFIAQCQRRVEIERLRKAEVRQMPAPAPEPAPPPVSPLEALLQAEDDRAFAVVTKKRRAAKAEAPPPPAVAPAERAAYDEREANRRATEAALAAARKAEAEERRQQMQKIMRARA